MVVRVDGSLFVGCLGVEFDEKTIRADGPSWTTKTRRASG